MKRYGSDLIVDLLRRYEIPYVALNPGASFRGLHDSLVNYGGNQPPIILCPHEEIAVMMAHGYAKTTGRPMAAIVHDTVGLLHCAMAVYVAYLDRVPLLLLGATGPLDTTRRRPHIDWIHSSALQAQPIRDYVKWDRQPASAAEVVDSFARAYRVAMQPPQGPVYLCYDAGFQEDPLDEEIPLPDPARVAPGTLPYPDPDALDAVAQMLVASHHPVILAGYAGRATRAVADLVRLAEAAGAAVVDLNHRLNFPNTHPLNLTHAHRELLGGADLVVAVDVKDLYGPLVTVDSTTRRSRFGLLAGCKLVEIGYRDVNISKWSDDFQQLVPVDVQILADAAVTLPLLAERVFVGVQADPQAGVRVRARSETLAGLHRAARTRWQEEARVDWDAAPMTTARLASEIWAAVRDEDWVLTANTLEDWTYKLWEFEHPQRHPGKSLGTSTQLGISLGVALAHRGSGRVVVDIQPDGDLLFDAGALWVAASQRLPLLVVMYNNRAYYNDWEHQIRMARQRGTPVENAWIGQAITDPPVDFAGLARAFGWHAEGPIADPRGAQDALRRAVAVVKQGRPALVDTVTRFR